MIAAETTVASTQSAVASHSPPKGPHLAEPDLLDLLCLNALATPKPFLKWAGGKRKLSDELRKHVPDNFGTYYEPFVGGGALFFSLRPKTAILGDWNMELANAYRVVRDDVDALVAELQSGRYVFDRGVFERIRDEEPTDPIARAARMIYLNRTCFNGLWRVNSKGQFNVPFGRYKSPVICDAPTLRACSAAMWDTEIKHEDFAWVADEAQPGDLVYFDPPCVPLSHTSSSPNCTQTGFPTEDQQRVRDVALALKRSGVHVLISTPYAPEVHDLYKDEFEISEVQAGRSISARGKGRGKVTELLMR